MRDMRLRSLFPVALFAFCMLATACKRSGSSAPDPHSTDDGGFPSTSGSATSATVDARSGFLTLVCAPGCDDIRVDGKSLGMSPLIRASLAPGEHDVRLTLGAKEKALQVTVLPGEVTGQRIEMDDPAVPSPSALKAETRARDELDAKLQKGNASVDEIRTLKAICSHLGDEVCRDRAAAALVAKLRK